MMIIQDVKEYAQDDLLDRLRQVTLKDQPEKRVYGDASMLVRFLHVGETAPAQYYVLYADLKRVSMLRQCILSYTDRAIDILDLKGYIRVTLDDGAVDVLPPIVEVSTESDGSSVRIVVDGIHRLYLARLEWKKPKVVLISNVRTPYYAFPIPGDDPWNRVKLYDTLPEGLLKRWPRQENHKQLFRDFDSVFCTRHTRRE